MAYNKKIKEEQAGYPTPAPHPPRGDLLDYGNFGMSSMIQMPCMEVH
jgi:hypothetical protein